MRGVGIGVIGLVAGSLLLTACGGTPSGDSSAPSSFGASTVASAPGSASQQALEGVAAEAAAFANLSDAQQEEQLATATAAAERTLLAASGLEEDLGGPAAAEAAYSAVAAALISQARVFASDPDFGRFGAGPVRAEDGGFGGMTFAGWLIAGTAMEGVVGQSNDFKEGGKPQSGKESRTFENGTSELTMSGTIESASLDWTLTSTQKGMTGSVRVKGTINPCPDPTGQFTAQLSIETSGGTNSGSVTSTNFDVTLTGQVDDTARITGYQTTTHSKASAGARGQVADMTSTATYGAEGIDEITGGDNQASGTSAEESQSWGLMGMLSEAMITKGLIKAATTGIESGRCVKIIATPTPSKTRGVKPSTSFSISAQPRSKIDGSPAGGTVTGTLNGGSTLDPAGTAVPADATYSYTAPEKEDERAEVTLVARSKRGVGKAGITFDTVVRRGYVIGEHVGPYYFSGVSCGSAAGPWEITYEMDGFPQMTGGGVIMLTFPGEPEPGDETTVFTTTGTDKGELKAVGLPGGVRFGGPAQATLRGFGAHRVLTITTSGMATGWARRKQRTAKGNVETFELTARTATASTCPSQ